MKKRVNWYITTSIILTIFILIPICGYWFINCCILTPQKLKTILQAELSQALKGEFSCESARLTYWETWPVISISINNGNFKSNEQHIKKDTIATQPKLSMEFKKLYAYINLLDLIKNKKISIDKILLKNPTILIKNGNKNLSKVVRKEKIHKYHIESFELIVQNGLLDWEDDNQHFNSVWKNVNMSLKGNLNSMNLKLNSDNIYLNVPEKAVKLNFPINFESELELNKKEKLINIKSSTANLENIPFEVSGKLQFITSHQLWMDIHLNLLATEFNHLFEYIPPTYLSTIKGYNIAGKTSLKGKFYGLLSKEVYPDIVLNGKITNGSIIQRKQSNGLDNINMNFTLVCPSSKPDASTLEINNLNISGLNSSVTANMKIKKLLSDPFIDLNLKSDINLNRLGTEFFNPKEIELSGDLKSNIELVFRLQDFTKGHYDRIWADGLLDIQHLYLKSDTYKLYAYISNTKGNIGYKENRSHFIKQREVLSASLHADTLNLRHEPNFRMSVSDFNFSSNTGLQQDTTVMTPITAHVSAKGIQAKVSHDIALLSSKFKLHLGVKASDKNKQKLNIATAFTSELLEYLNIKEQQATKIINSELMSEVTLPKEKGKNSLLNFQQNLQQSDIKGFFLFDKIHSYSKKFPLHIKFYETKIGLKNNYLILNNAKVHIGNSDALVNGHIKTYLKFNKPFIEGNLSVNSEDLNLDELKKAYLYKLNFKKNNQESKYNEQLLNLENLKESLHKQKNEEESLDKVKDQLLKVPNNCAFTISLNAKKINIRNLIMENVNSKINLADEKALFNFSTLTNMGDIHGNLSYKYLNPNRADIYLDCMTHRIQVGKFKEVFPEINTLFPLLTTMEGVLNSKIITFFSLESNMNIDLSSLYATCSLQGENMVLFTNEIYHQIAKKLHFKDKERNIIDKIDVDLIAQNNTINVFPFILDMDRCSFLVGGEHNMNMNFSYHVDVLRSFIPINFGVNVNGNIDDLRYQLTKTKYKNLFKEPIRHEEFKMEKKRKMNEAQAKILKLADKCIIVP